MTDNPILTARLIEEYEEALAGLRRGYDFSKDGISNQRALLRDIRAHGPVCYRGKCYSMGANSSIQVIEGVRVLGGEG